MILKTIKQIEIILPHLIMPDVEVTESFVDEINLRIKEMPETILIQADINKDGELTAFGIMIDPGPKLPYTLMPQVWSSTDGDSDWFTPMLTRAILWTIGRGKTSIRGQTTRNLSAMYRKFKFEPFLQVIKLDLKPYVEGLEPYLKEFLSHG